MMKTLIATTAAAAALCAMPALAQAQEAPTGVYGALGYADTHSKSSDLGVIQGKLGYRIMPYAGVEGDAGFGVNSDGRNVDTALGPVRANAKIKSQFAAYGVGFLPLSPNTDLLARVGYGTSRIRVGVPSQTVGGVNIPGVSDSSWQDSWNFGVGAQHHFDGQNGIRADYTYQDFNHGGGHANVWTVGYVRRF
jgi:opacity protein-like surface antigen